MADLTTLADVRRYLFGNDQTLDADGILASLITSSSAWVTSRIGRTYGTATVTEPRNGDGTSRMLLLQSPATAVTSVTMDGTALVARATVSDTGYVLSDNGIDLIGSVFAVGIQNVVFVYTAGEAVPSPVAQATIEHVAFKFKRRENLGRSSASAGGDTVSYADAGVLAGIEDLLAPYKRLVFS